MTYGAYPARRAVAERVRAGLCATSEGAALGPVLGRTPQADAIKR